MARVIDRDLGWKAIKREMLKAKTLEVVVGILEGAKDSEGVSIAEYATYNEFGGTAKHQGGTRYSVSSEGAKFVSNSFVGPVHGVTGAHDIVIPSRPFMRTAFDEAREKIGKDMNTQGKRMALGKATAQQALTIIGQRHAARVQNVITGRNFLPKLAPQTIKAKKGSTKTLVDTGAMVNAVQISVRARS